jgi:hypothetical protein
LTKPDNSGRTPVMDHFMYALDDRPLGLQVGGPNLRVPDEY